MVCFLRRFRLYGNFIIKQKFCFTFVILCLLDMYCSTNTIWWRYGYSVLYSIDLSTVFFFSTSNMDNLGKIRRLHCTEQLYKLAKLSSLKLIRRKLKLTPLKSQTFLWRGEGGTNLLPTKQTSVNFLNFAKLYLRFFLTNSKVFFPLVLTDSLPSILTMSKVEKKSIALYVRVSLFSA